MSSTEEKINVMFLETSMRIGGTETVVTQLVKRIDPKRFRPVLCCLYEPGILGERLIKEGYAVHHSLAGKRFDLGLPIRLYKLMKKEKIDVVFIVNQPITQLWGVVCSKLAGVKGRITAIRSTGKVNRIKRRLLLNRLTFPWVERVTALSNMHRAYLHEKEGIALNHMEIIPNGVDLTRFRFNGEPEKIRESLGLKPGAPVVGIVAMLRPEKGHEMFLRSARSIVSQVPDAQFLIVGEGNERPKLEQLAKDFQIESHVRFLGARNDVPAVVSLFDVAVLSSRPVVETLSNAVLEYMAAGKPVVSTRVGSVPEQIDEGKTGFLVEPGDWEAMGERITRLLKDQDLKKKMGQASYDKVVQRYSLEQMIGGTENLIVRLARMNGVNP